MKYTIEIREALARSIEVEAECLDDAVSKVEEMYYDEEVVLDADDYQSTEFVCTDEM